MSATHPIPSGPHWAVIETESKQYDSYPSEIVLTNYSAFDSEALALRYIESLPERTPLAHIRLLHIDRTPKVERRVVCSSVGEPA